MSIFSPADKDVRQLAIKWIIAKRQVMNVATHMRQAEHDLNEVTKELADLLAPDQVVVTDGERRLGIQKFCSNYNGYRQDEIREVHIT